jgi:hypothetical protein
VQAAIGDKLVVRGRHVGEHGRAATVLAVGGPEGGPPYLVRWEEDGHESTFFPGPDTAVEHLPAPPGG